MHVNEGTLRAYLDGELEQAQAGRVAAHLRGCGACRTQLEQLAARSAVTRQALALLAPPSPESLGRAGFRPRPRHEGVWTMTRKFRFVGATLVICAIVGVLLSLAPVRAAASQFLGLFRVRKFAIISVSPTTFSDLDGAAVQEQLAQMLSEDVSVVREAEDPVRVASLEEAARRAGFQPRMPAALDTPSVIEVQNGFELRYRFDAGRAQALLDMLGEGDMHVPASLHGAMIHVDMRSIVAAQFKASNRKKFLLIQAPSPSVDLPPDVDLDALGEMYLELLGLSPAEARQAAAAIEWTSTLVIPLPQGAASYRDVRVDGSQGLFIEEPSGEDDLPAFTLLWEKDGVVYALAGEGSIDVALQIANSLQ